MSAPKKWRQPKQPDRATQAFPAMVIGKYLPEVHEIPQEFRDDGAGFLEWKRFFYMLFAGIGRDNFAGVVLQEGIDGEVAFSHLQVCCGSYEPKQEHKEAGVAWLASLWFKRVVWKDDEDYVAAQAAEAERGES